MPDSELERVFVTFLANDKDLERTYQQIVRRAKEVSAEVSKAFDQSVAKGFTDAGEKVARSAKRQADAVDEVEAAFKALRNETAALRHTVEAGDTAQQDAIKRFNELQQAALHQARGFEVTTDEYRKFTQVAAQASRSVATLEGRATKLGFSANAAVGITAAFNQNLSRMGAAGDVAGEALGIISREFRLLMQLDPVTFVRNLGNSITVLSIAGSALAAAAIGGLTVALFKMGEAAADAADAIDKGSQSAGLSAEAYQELRYAFEQNGVEVGQFDMAVQALNRRLGLAAQGNQTYAKAYEQLGISIRDANGSLRGTEDLIMEVIQALSELPNAAEQAALASTIFNDDVAKKLIPTIRAGGDALQELRDQARSLGLILSGDAILSLVEFKDTVAEMRRQFETARLEIVGAFIPIFNDLLLPLLQNTVVPALQGVAQRVRDFSQAFLDAGPAGAEFRAQMLGNIQPLLSFADVVIGVGQGFMSFVQLVLGGAAGIGASLGELSVQLERFASGMANITEGLAWWQQGNLLGALEIFKRARNLGSEVFDPSGITDAFNRAADSYLDRSYDLAVEAQERLARGLSGDYTDAFDRLTAGIRNAVSAGADSFAPALTNAVNDAVTSGALKGVEELPEGSLAALRAQVTAARREFELATTEEARQGAMDRIAVAEAEIAAIEAIYARSDPLAPARAWVARFAAELEFGLTTADAVFKEIAPRVEQLREEAAAALKEFGFDSQQYRDAVGKLGILEELLKAVAEERKVSLTLDASAVVTGLTELVPPDVVANVLDKPLANASFLIHKYAGDTSDTLHASREDWEDYANNVALATHQVATGMNVASDAVSIYGDTLKAMIGAGAGTLELFDALSRSPAFSMTLMTGPGGEPADTGLLRAALAEQAAAYEAVQAAMTEEALEQAGRRYQAATEEVERLKELYAGASIPAPEVVGVSITDVLTRMSQELRVAEAAAIAFGDATGGAAEKQAILERAIRGILAINPAADVQDLVVAWEMLAAGTEDVAGGLSGLALVARDLEDAMSRLKELTSEAPSEWDQLRSAFEAAAASGLITNDVLRELLALLEELERKAASGSTALSDWARGFDIAGDISDGLTRSLEGIRDGDIQGVLGGLTQLGVGIGTAIGGPMVGALVGAIGGFLETLPRLFQAISDLFTGDSPARRELAASLSQTIAGAFRVGILDGLRGADDWQDNLKQGVTDAVFGALVDAFIQAAVIEAIFAPFIDTFTKLLHSSGMEEAFAFFDREFAGVFDDAMNVIENFVQRGRRFFNDSRNDPSLTQPDPVTFSLPDATVSVLAAPQWALEMGVAAEHVREGGLAIREAADIMRDTFAAGINVNNTSARGIDAYRGAA